MFKKKKIVRKCKSKKGMTLIEILVGVTIVVIVFASCLGALVSGYTTTMYNADENRASAMNESLNELIGNLVGKMGISDSDDALDLYDGINDIKENGSEDYEDTYSEAIVESVDDMMPGAVYVKAEAVNPDAEDTDYTVEFPNGESYQYTIIPSTNTVLTKDDKPYTISGITIKTCFESAAGPIIYESFIAYAK